MAAVYRRRLHAFAAGGGDGIAGGSAPVFDGRCLHSSGTEAQGEWIVHAIATQPLWTAGQQQGWIEEVQGSRPICPYRFAYFCLGCMALRSPTESLMAALCSAVQSGRPPVDIYFLFTESVHRRLFNLGCNLCVLVLDMYLAGSTDFLGARGLQWSQVKWLVQTGFSGRLSPRSREPRDSRDLAKVEGLLLRLFQVRPFAFGLPEVGQEAAAVLGALTFTNSLLKAKLLALCASGG